jgi:hypothetical protein
MRRGRAAETTECQPCLENKQVQRVDAANEGDEFEANLRKSVDIICGIFGQPGQHIAELRMKIEETQLSEEIVKVNCLEGRHRADECEAVEYGVEFCDASHRRSPHLKFENRKPERFLNEPKPMGEEARPNWLVKNAGEVDHDGALKEFSEPIELEDGTCTCGMVRKFADIFLVGKTKMEEQQFCANHDVQSLESSSKLTNLSKDAAAVGENSLNLSSLSDKERTITVAGNTGSFSSIAIGPGNSDVPNFLWRPDGGGQRCMFVSSLEAEEPPAITQPLKNENARKCQLMLDKAAVVDCVLEIDRLQCDVYVFGSTKLRIHEGVQGDKMKLEKRKNFESVRPLEGSEIFGRLIVRATTIILNIWRPLNRWKAWRKSFFMMEERIIESKSPVLDKDADHVVTSSDYLLQSAKKLIRKLDIPGKLLWKQPKMSQELASHFWHRLVQEYSPTILSRPMKFEDERPLAVEVFVKVVDEETVRNNWVKGRVIEIILSSDGKIRTVTIKTESGIRVRSVSNSACLDQKDSDFE